MKTIILNDNPYGGLIQQYFNQEFPDISIMNKSDMLEVLSTILMGTKEIRYGSLPTLESQVIIRKAIIDAINDNTPIPILIPWGSIKSNFSANLDIAEVSAISTLVQLSKKVKNIYPQGLEIVIRVEDTSGYKLFSMEANIEEIKDYMDLYTENFCNLVEILSEGCNIRTIKESKMPTNNSFNFTFEGILPIMEKYLLESEFLIEFDPKKVYELESFKALQLMGFKGIVSKEQRDYYYNTYKRLYSSWDQDQLTRRLALYLTGSFTRFILNMTGKQDYWNNFIQISFVAPIKGLPEGYSSNYIYYRSLPTSSARTHICPWRARGYFKISGSSICPKICSWGDDDTISQLEPCQIMISNEQKSVLINTDYLLID